MDLDITFTKNKPQNICQKKKKHYIKKQIFHTGTDGEQNLYNSK